MDQRQEEKNKIIDILTIFKNNFDYTDIKDYQSLLLFLNECIKENETDAEIISLLQEALDNVEKNKNQIDLHKFDKGETKKATVKRQDDRIMLSAIGAAKHQKYDELSDAIKEVISYRIFNPEDKKNNYMIR